MSPGSHGMMLPTLRVGLPSLGGHLCKHLHRLHAKVCRLAITASSRKVFGQRKGLMRLLALIREACAVRADERRLNVLLRRANIWVLSASRLLAFQGHCRRELWKEGQSRKIRGRTVSSHLCTAVITDRSCRYLHGVRRRTGLSAVRQAGDSSEDLSVLNCYRLSEEVGKLQSSAAWPQRAPVDTSSLVVTQMALVKLNGSKQNQNSWVWEEMGRVLARMGRR